MDKVILKKKILHHAKNRGLKEIETILQSFTQKFLKLMSLKNMHEFTELLKENDVDMLEWIILAKKPPERLQSNSILKQIINSCNEQ